MFQHNFYLAKYDKCFNCFDMFLCTCTCVILDAGLPQGIIGMFKQFCVMCILLSVLIAGTMAEAPTLHLCAVCKENFPDVGELQQHLMTHVQGTVNSVSLQVFNTSRRKTKMTKVTSLQSVSHGQQSTECKNNNEGLDDLERKKCKVASNETCSLSGSCDRQPSEHISITKGNDDEQNNVFQNHNEETHVTNSSNGKCTNIVEFESGDIDKNFKEQGKGFVCAIGPCKYRSTKQSRMRTHVRTHTFSNCTVCARGYFTIQSIQSLEGPCKGHKPNLCGRCMDDITNSSLENQEGLIMCQLCDQGYNSVLDLKLHLNQHSGFNMYRCKVCKNIYGTEMLLNLHQDKCITNRMDRKRQTDDLSCEECGKEFPDRHRLNRHIETHIKRVSPDKVYRCHVCCSEYRMKHHFDRHLQRHVQSHLAEQLS